MIDGKRVLALIPARAGSQRLAGKNVRPLAGRPMIDWTFQAALGARLLDRIVISTDDPAVVALAAERGLEPPIERPVALAGSESSVIDAIAHALQTIGGAWDYLVLLQPTSPLRVPADIDGAVTLCHQRGAPAVLGVATLSKPAAFYGRVGADDVYRPDDTDTSGRLGRVNGAVYVGRPERLLSDRTFQVPGALAWRMPPERSWDVDTALDFSVCESLFVSASAPSG